jgi:hypothetical protein
MKPKPTEKKKHKPIQGINQSVYLGKNKDDFKNSTKDRSTPIKGASPKVPKKPWVGFKMEGGDFWPNKINPGTASTKPRVTGEHPKHTITKK